MMAVVVCLVVAALGVIVYFAVWAPSQNSPNTLIVQPGAPGPAGAPGAAGATGASGADGAAGVQGNQGSQGDQGAQGNQGSQGNQGDQGTQGSGTAVDPPTTTGP